MLKAPETPIPAVPKYVETLEIPETAIPAAAEYVETPETPIPVVT